MDNIGLRIRAERTRQNKSARTLAAAVRVSPAAVAMWESGQTKNLRPENLLAVADELYLSMRWLITGRGSKTPGVPGVAEEAADYRVADLTPDAREIGRQWEKLSREAREQVRQHIYLLTVLAAAGLSKQLPKKFSEFESLLHRRFLHKKPSQAA